MEPLLVTVGAILLFYNFLFDGSVTQAWKVANFLHNDDTERTPISGRLILAFFSGFTLWGAAVDIKENTGSFWLASIREIIPLNTELLCAITGIVFVVVTLVLRTMAPKKIKNRIPFFIFGAIKMSMVPLGVVTICNWIMFSLGKPDWFINIPLPVLYKNLLLAFPITTVIYIVALLLKGSACKHDTIQGIRKPKVYGPRDIKELY